jgi:hypothetical protein
MIIGGIQDAEKVNNVHLLFYHTENFRLGGTGPTSTYDIRVEVRQADITTHKDFEICINQA